MLPVTGRGLYSKLTGQFWVRLSIAFMGIVESLSKMSEPLIVMSKLIYYDAPLFTTNSLRARNCLVLNTLRALPLSCQERGPGGEFNEHST